MNRSVLFLLLTACATSLRAQPSPPQNPYPYSKLQEEAFTDVKIKDDFWQPKIRRIAETTLPLILEFCEKQGRIENFKIVAGRSTAEYSMMNSPDAPIYKLVEAAAYTLVQIPNPALEKAVDELIDLVAATQAQSGYLHTEFMLPADHPSAPPVDQKNVKTFGFGKQYQWRSVYTEWPFGYSQLYTAGHLFEAAAAYYRATGKRKFLDVALKLADHIQEVFASEAFLESYADHPQVEIGLMKLYEITGNKNYVDLAERFCRHIKFVRPVDLHQEQNQLPLDQQRNAYGHCVRTAYLYSGATDVLRAKPALGLRTAIDSLWASVVGRKTYIHGGIGNGTEAEQHGEDYDLPIVDTYSECCANIAMGQWNHRLNLMTGQARYADLVEHESYNAALSGIGLDGRTFFYSNKINIDTEGRKGKHGGVRETYLFCCPAKLPIFVAGISRWIYAKTDNSLSVNLYIGNELRTQVGGDSLQLAVKTGYPWNGNSEVTFEKDCPREIALRLRLPGWLTSDQPFAHGLYYFDKNTPRFGYEIKLNGQIIAPTIENGYAVILRKWEKGDRLELNFGMKPVRVYTDAQVKQNAGRVALMQGPVLYCLEGVDNKFNVLDFVLPPDAQITSTYQPNLLGGCNVLTGTGLYQGKKVPFKAIPYHLWQNRGISEMSLLLIENPDKIYQEKKEKRGKVNTNG